ncbi:putative pumilio homolog 20 isoform X2 [Apium graveolens]|uniref:putative pumilio homolog 20 isoform X2 n=1 Tax=Apium graveolens TaxID=4045 RepID=UPI003D7B5D9B
MENHNAPLYSTSSNFRDFDNVLTSLQNLDLDNVVYNNQESSLRNLDHGVFDGSCYSSYSPELQYVDWSNNVHRPQVQSDWSSSAVHRPQVLDHAGPWGRHGSAENLYSCVPSVLKNPVGTSTFLDDERMRTSPFSECSGMNNVANQYSGIPVPCDAARAYDPRYLGGYSTSQNGYCSPGLSQTRSNGQNGYHDQGFTQKKSNVGNGYCNQGSRNANYVPSMACLANPLYIVSTAMMKEGSMCLQNLLLDGNQEHKTAILVGVLDHIYQLIMDQYGHHMIDKLIESCGEYELQQILEKLAAEPDLLVTAACSKEGSSSLQKLIKHLKKSPQRFRLTSALAPKVVELATNKTARHVFKECLNLLGSQANMVLYEEAIKHFDTLARDEVGCLALNDCIDFATNYLERERILQLVIDNAVSLAYDPYGNYIVQNAVKIPECGDQICRKLRGHYIYLSTKKSGSHVVEKCMEACSSAVMQGLEEILEKKQALELACNEYGNYVIQTALRATQAQNCNLQLRNSLIKALLPGLDRLRDTKAGRNLASRIQDLAYPRHR